MAIDATIWDVTRDSEPIDDEDIVPIKRIKLWLKNRESNGIAGQSRLIVINDVDNIEWLVGKNIWAAGNGVIMCENIAIGKRIGYTRCELDRLAIYYAVGKNIEDFNLNNNIIL